MFSPTIAITADAAAIHMRGCASGSSSTATTSLTMASRASCDGSHPARIACAISRRSLRRIGRPCPQPPAVFGVLAVAFAILRRCRFRFARLGITKLYHVSLRFPNDQHQTNRRRHPHTAPRRCSGLNTTAQELRRCSLIIRRCPASGDRGAGGDEPTRNRVKRLDRFCQQPAHC